MGSKQKLLALLSAAALTGFTGCASANDGSEHPTQAATASPASPALLKPEIVATHPFDPGLFTQGLEVDGDELIVGTGQYGEGRVLRMKVGSDAAGVGVVKQLPANQFGEGITRAGDIVWQLTWKDGIAYKRDARTLEELGQVRYSGEGWGLCATPEHLVMSDGTATLRILDRTTFAEQRRIEVRDERGPVTRLNELECVGNRVLANRFTSTEIVQIEADGTVSARIDASSLPNRAAADPNNVLNGIAAIPGTDRYYLTGKRWPDLYEVRFVPAS